MFSKFQKPKTLPGNRDAILFSIETENKSDLQNLDCENENLEWKSLGSFSKL